MNASLPTITVNGPALPVANTVPVFSIAPAQNLDTNFELADVLTNFELPQSKIQQPVIPQEKTDNQPKTVYCNEETVIGIDKFGKITDRKNDVPADCIKNGSYTLDSDGKILFVQNNADNYFGKYVYDSSNNELICRNLIHKTKNTLEARQYLNNGQFSVAIENSKKYTKEMKSGEIVSFWNEDHYSTNQIDRIIDGPSSVIVFSEKGNTNLVLEKQSDGTYKVISNNIESIMTAASAKKGLHNIYGEQATQPEQKVETTVEPKYPYNHMFLKEPISLSNAQVKILEKTDKQQQWVLFDRGGKTLESLTPAQLSILSKMDTQQLFILFDKCSPETIINLDPAQLEQLAEKEPRDIYILYGKKQ